MPPSSFVSPASFASLRLESVAAFAPMPNETTPLITPPPCHRKVFAPSPLVTPCAIVQQVTVNAFARQLNVTALHIAPPDTANVLSPARATMFASTCPPDIEN